MTRYPGLYMLHILPVLSEPSSRIASRFSARSLCAFFSDPIRWCTLLAFNESPSSFPAHSNFLLTRCLSQMHVASTSSPEPLEEPLTFPHLLDRQLTQSPHHTAYIYDTGTGEVASVTFERYIRSMYATCRRILRETVPHTPVEGGQNTVIAILANADNLSCCMMVSAVMRAGLVPFCVSPSDAAAGVAQLFEQTDTAIVYVSADLKGILADALAVHDKDIPVFDFVTFSEVQEVLEESSDSDSEPLPPLPVTIDLEGPGLILHSSGSPSKPVYLSHRLVLQISSVPWADSQDHGDETVGTHTSPTLLYLGVLIHLRPEHSADLSDDEKGCQLLEQIRVILEKNSQKNPSLSNTTSSSSLSIAKTEATSEKNS
ncbi:hypothetical protein R3P38DRAFT_2910317 [Favolaschia claudopus]|uniref:AMP-dependent synthetase/ligase domain-containing protein n=1 Tax=Favolaschia claudopus TaxID=2862362 RepID=A0AAW0C9T7_9AGAR